MNSTIEMLEMQKFSGIASNSLSIKLFSSSAILIMLAVGFIIQKKLYIFLKNRSKRFINKIILTNFYIQNITTPILLCYFLLRLWTYNPSQYISKDGCYVISFILQYNLMIDRSTSLFINLFRYICIVHDDFLKKFDIHPKVSTSYSWNTFKTKSNF